MELKAVCEIGKWETRNNTTVKIIRTSEARKRTDSRNAGNGEIK